MCLRTAVESPDRVLDKGEILGHEYVITHNRMGFLCGYLKVEPGHPWHGVHHRELENVDVHGSLTFSEPDVDCDAEGPDSGYWVGFDCGHGFDLPDLTLPIMDEMRESQKRLVKVYENSAFSGMARKWDVPRVREQIEGIAEQAVLARVLSAGGIA